MSRSVVPLPPSYSTFGLYALPVHRVAGRAVLFGRPLLIILWDPISSRLGLPDIGYVTSMLVVITLWIAVAPLAATRKAKKA